MTTAFEIDEATALAVDEALDHAGVKGMKWGVRRANPSGVGKPKSPTNPAGNQRGKSVDKKPESPTHTEPPAKVKPKKASEMTTEELQKAISRLDMERRYSQLTSSPEAKTRTEKIKQAAGEILAKSSKDAANRILTDAAVAVGKQGLALALKKSGKSSLIDAAEMLVKTKKDKKTT